MKFRFLILLSLKSGIKHRSSVLKVQLILTSVPCMSLSLVTLYRKKFCITFVAPRIKSKYIVRIKTQLSDTGDFISVNFFMLEFWDLQFNSAPNDSFWEAFHTYLRS